MKKASIEDLFKARIKLELEMAEQRYTQLCDLYDTTKRIPNISDGYLDYVRRERDIAFMVYQAKQSFYKQYK